LAGHLETKDKELDILSEAIKGDFDQEMEFIITQMIKDYRWMAREVGRL
jgi:hypothetical protein